MRHPSPFVVTCRHFPPKSTHSYRYKLKVTVPASCSHKWNHFQWIRKNGRWFLWTFQERAAFERVHHSHLTRVSPREKQLCEKNRVVVRPSCVSDVRYSFFTFILALSLSHSKSASRVESEDHRWPMTPEAGRRVSAGSWPTEITKLGKVHARAAGPGCIMRIMRSLATYGEARRRTWLPYTAAQTRKSCGFSILRPRD